MVGRRGERGGRGKKRRRGSGRTQHHNFNYYFNHSYKPAFRRRAIDKRKVEHPESEAEIPPKLVATDPEVGEKPAFKREDIFGQGPSGEKNIADKSNPLIVNLDIGSGEGPQNISQATAEAWSSELTAVAIINLGNGSRKESGNNSKETAHKSTKGPKPTTRRQSRKQSKKKVPSTSDEGSSRTSEKENCDNVKSPCSECLTTEDKGVFVANIPLRRFCFFQMDMKSIHDMVSHGLATYREDGMENKSAVFDVAVHQLKSESEEGHAFVPCSFGGKCMSKAPHFPQQPVARQNEDGSLELECYVDANPKPDIKWFYDNKEVKPDGRFSLRLDTRGSDQYSAVLSIKDLADSDAGAYRCAIVNPHGKGNANFNLKLTGFSSPTFVEKPQISSRDDGQVMVMEFRAKSILKPVFVWSKVGDEIISPSDRVQVVLREEPNQIYYSALEIKDPTKEKDAGQFICTAKNDSGKLTATFTVKFEVPQGAPTFTRKPQILQKTSDSGDPAIVFDIGYQADRNPEVIWINPKGKKMKESSRIKFGTSADGGSNTFTATLELKNYKAKDSGTYTCNIKNDAGEANVELTLNIEGPMDDGADENSDA